MSKGIDRNIIKYVIDLGLGISFLLVFITGVIKYPGFLRSLGTSHLYLPMGLLTQIHDNAGIIMGALVFVHLFLNYKWIVAMTRRVLGRS